MKFKSVLIASALFAAPSSLLAADNVAVEPVQSAPYTAAEVGSWFVGVGVNSGGAWGDSDQTNGGGFGLNGEVRDVKFDATFGVGAQVGYKIDRNWTAFASYDWVNGGVSWNALFASVPETTYFDGDATSHILLANIGYQWNANESTSFGAMGGLGVTFNRLSGVVETDATGGFLSDVHSNTETNFAARVGLGVEHKLAQNVSIGINAKIDYVGDFQTADTRFGNLGVTNIMPYEIEDVWRGSVGATLKVSF